MALGRQAFLADRIVTYVSALAIIALVLFLLVRNEPIADPRLFFALRLVLSFATAALAAAIPGFLYVRWSGAGLAVRAGGALALFVLTFVYTPDVLANPVNLQGATIIQGSSGPGSPPVGVNNGTMNIGRDK
jgi:hypothetical protein